ncbi:MAG: restriction endonuclease subunit S [Ruminococcus sp.]|nr:restriction endonuclease subunit S [Ruminococcus sp.]
MPCIHYGQIYTRYGLFADKTLTFISEEAAKKQKFAVKNDIVMAVTSENIDDVCKCVAWLGEDNIAVSGHTAIIHHTLNPKYLCYYFHTAKFQVQKNKLAHGTKVMEVTPDKLNDIIIPVPPIAIQAEIAKILDEYSTSVDFLQQELEKELTARKKQYEYYRDLLLDFGVHGGGQVSANGGRSEKYAISKLVLAGKD